VIQQQAGIDVERALFSLVANRACAPASKLYCHEQWLREDAHIDRTQNLKLHQFYRAMDFLEANKDAIEQAIFHRVADLLDLDVEVIFYDTTSLHFEIDEEDEGDKDGNVQGSQAAGKKSYVAPRQRGHSKNGRRRATDRGRHGGHPGRIPGAALGVLRQHGRRHHGRQGQGSHRRRG